MTIRVLSFDFDGCLFNLNFINSFEKDVIASNKPFLDTLKKQNNNYTHSVVFVGSNRQSKAVDDNNSWGKGSCFPAVKKVSSYLNAQLDTFLLADIYGNLADGTSFKKATINPDDDQHAHWLFDETKATILYAQMHKIALEHPHEDIVFDFYDDRGTKITPDILEHLKAFYTKYDHLIPKNLTLRLNHYAGSTLTHLASVQGTGFIDSNYRQTVKDMAAQALLHGGNGMDKPLYTAHTVRPDLLGNRVPLITSQKQITDQLDIIQAKALRLKKNGHSTAGKKAQDLHDTIKKATDLYFAGNLTPHDCRVQCDDAIKAARPELETHRGWKEVLGNLALIILGVVGFVVKECINMAQNKPFLFFSKTESAKMVDAIEITLDSVVPPPV